LFTIHERFVDTDFAMPNGGAAAAATMVCRVELLLGIDMGTGSTKGVLVDTSGSVIASETIAHSMNLPRPGWAEVDAEAMWWREVCEISAALIAQMPSGAALAGMCVSGVGPCLVLCDQNLTPLRPAILYGIDTRAIDEIASLTAEFGEQNILDRAGTLLSSQAVGPKLEWVRRHEPQVFERAAGWYGSNSYVAAKLTGEYVMDHHTASQCDPLYATREFDWNHEWAQRICGHLPLPRLVWPSDVVGAVSPAAAAATGVPAGTPVAAGTVDAYSEAFSVGVRRPGDQMLMYGSTMFLVQIIDEYYSDPTLWTTAGVDHQSLALAAGTSTAGSLIGWLQRVTGGASFEDLMAEAQSVPPGSEGLLVLPYLAGERTPVLDPQARGVLAGLTLRHGRGHLFALPTKAFRSASGRSWNASTTPTPACGPLLSVGDCAARSGRRRSAISRGAHSWSPNKPSVQVTVTPFWPRSASALSHRPLTGRRSRGRSSRIRATAISTTTCTRHGRSCTPPPRVRCTGWPPPIPTEVSPSCSRHRPECRRR
jgi:xylulokinase